MPLFRRVLLFSGICAASIAFDQASKVWAESLLRGQPAVTFLGDTFRLQFATNVGAFLSLGGRLQPQARFLVLTVGVGVLLLGLAVYAHLVTRLEATQVAGYALIFSGGASNWFDRARFDGAVVDFMNLGLGSLRTGVFNVADVAIVAGVALLLLGSAGQAR